MRADERVAVTGLGILVSSARDVDGFASSLLDGVTGVSRIDCFDTSAYRSGRAAQVLDFDPAAYGIPAGMDRTTQFAVAVTQQAVVDAGLEITDRNRFRTSVSVATCLGGLLGHIGLMRSAQAGNARKDMEEPFDDVPDLPPCQLASALASHFGTRGGNSTAVTACASGGNAIAGAVEMIRGGRSDAVLIAGADPLNELMFSGFSILMALSPTTCRPFDRERDGLLMGEGAGSLVLEAWAHARARGARIYGEVLGYGLGNDGHHVTQPDPHAGGARRAILRALRDARLSADDIDYINAHGTGTAHNDPVELKAIRSVYGERRVPVSSIKSMIGHTMGAAGVVEAVATILGLYRRFLPPTVNFRQPIPEYAGGDFVPDRGRHDPDLRHAASHSVGFGGNVVCLVFAGPPDAARDWALRRGPDGESLCR